MSDGKKDISKIRELNESFSKGSKRFDKPSQQDLDSLTVFLQGDKKSDSNDGNK